MGGSPERTPPAAPATGAAVTPLHVVAAVMRDANGRILLARRTDGRDLAGAWEFPGGKVEPGETAAQALARELREELGVAVDPAACQPLIAVPQQMPRKRIVLDVHVVDAWAGRPRGLEGQALAWTPLEQLRRYPMPPADIPVVGALTQPAHLVISPDLAPADAASPRARARWLDGLAASAAAAGDCRVQLRVRDLDDAALAALAADARHALDGLPAAPMLNLGPPPAAGEGGGRALAAHPRLRLARTLGLGLHLPAAWLGAIEARAALGEAASGVAVTAACHDAHDLARAQALGVDAALLGPVLPTASHPGARGLGWAAFVEHRAHASLPIYALGGLGPADLAAARRHGAQGIAAIRGYASG